jgi:formate hydrogenlyase transcriptional activator
MDIGSLQKVVTAVADCPSLDSALQVVVRGLAAQSDIALARIWLVGPGDQCGECRMRPACPNQERCLHLAASAGSPIHLSVAAELGATNWSQIDGDFRRIPLNAPVKVGYIGGAGQALRIRIEEGVEKPQWISRPDWARAQRIRNFGGQPLLFRGDVLGVLAVFSRGELTDEEFAWLRSLADHVALAITKIRVAEVSSKSEESLRHSGDQYRLLVETATDSVISMDGAGRILLANPATTRVFGYSTPELIGQPLTNLMPERLRGRHVAGLERYQKSGQRSLDWKGIELVGVRKSGDEFPIEVSFGEVVRDGRRTFTGFIRDISERKRVEDALRESEQRFRLLLELNNLLVSNLDFSQLIREVSTNVRRLLRCDVVGLLLVDTEKSQVRVGAWDSGDGAQKHGSDAVFPLRGSPSGVVLSTRKPMLLSRVDSTKFEHGIHRVGLAEGLESWLYLPLISRGRPVGTVVTGRVREASFNQDESDFMGQIASQVAIAVDNALNYQQVVTAGARLASEKSYLEEEIRQEYNFAEIVGNHRSLMDVLANVALVAPTDSSVLIHGETGTGKELIARAIHAKSNRKDRPLVKVNCGSIPQGLVESELFGHVKGAFTGASANRTGRFELANGGTIFLDEVGELPLDTQVKLLRVLQEQEFEPVGSDRTVRVDVRVVSATNRDLPKAIEAGQFRDDLYYRLNVVPMRMPSLRERRSDIPQLVMFFLDRACRKTGRKIGGVSPETMKVLVDHHWPGNIRELQNVMERGVVMCQGAILDLQPGLIAMERPRNTTAAIESHPAAVPPVELGTLEDVERRHILAVLDRTSGQISGPGGAAAILNLHPNTLRGRMQRLGLTNPERKSGSGGAVE